MARKPKGAAPGSDLSSPVKKLSEPFESIFAKTFDHDERMVWLAKCDPIFDADLKTVILSPQTIFAHDWIIYNFSGRLSACSPWKIIDPATGKSSDFTPRHPDDLRRQLESDLCDLEEIIRDCPAPVLNLSRRSGMQQLDFSSVMIALRTMGNSMRDGMATTVRDRPIRQDKLSAQELAAHRKRMIDFLVTIPGQEKWRGMFERDSTYQLATAARHRGYERHAHDPIAA